MVKPYLNRMVRNVRAILLFYRRIFIPAIFVAALVGAFHASVKGTPFPGATGIVLIYVSPLFHLFIYDILKPREYYFYNNLGLSRANLWLASILINTFIGLLITFLF